jgi:prolyl-tRNA editing enzyme YbaK/EbsC (Cys-tRNA(Pro) deacylase)
LVIASGTARIDLKRVAEHLGLARKRLKMADAPTVLEIAGYAVGAMTPFGHKTNLRTLIDRCVFEQAEVFGGGGEINALLRLTPAELARVTGGEQVDVIQENGQ